MTYKYSILSNFWSVYEKHRLGKIKGKADKHAFKHSSPKKILMPLGKRHY